jgi:hypothetical protein
VGLNFFYYATPSQEPLEKGVFDLVSSDSGSAAQICEAKMQAAGSVANLTRCCLQRAGAARGDYPAFKK